MPEVNTPDEDRRDAARQFVQDLENVSKFVVQPVVDRMDERWDNFNVRFTAFQEDVRRGLDQTAATLRMITDPESGYVPRAQYDMFVKTTSAEFEVVNTKLGDFPRWVIGTAIAACSAGATIAALIFTIANAIAGKNH